MKKERNNGFKGGEACAHAQKGYGLFCSFKASQTCQTPSCLEHRYPSATNWLIGYWVEHEGGLFSPRDLCGWFGVHDWEKS